MSKFLQILLIASIAVALCAAEAPLRQRTARLQQRRSRFFLARQEAAAAEEEAAVTPYPTANELKPEVPFEEVEQSLPSDISGAAAAAPHHPDETYGPPEVDTDDLPADEEEDIAVPAEAPVALPADAQAAEEAIAAAEEEEQIRAERLIAARRFGARRSARPAKLRAAPKARASARLQQLPVQQQFVPQVQQMFYYPAQLQAW